MALLVLPEMVHLLTQLVSVFFLGISSTDGFTINMFYAPGSFRNSTRSRQRKSSGIEPYNYDTDGTRSASPGLNQSLEAGASRTASRLSASEMHINSILNENPTASTPPYIPRNGRGRWPRDTGGDRGGPQRIMLKTQLHQIPAST